MSSTKRVSTVVSPTGIGRKDYSQNVEFSVETAIRSLQERFFYSYSYRSLAGLVFPSVYESQLQFLINGALQYNAPSEKPWIFYLVETTTNTNDLCIVTLNRYATIDDFNSGTITEHLGTALGFVEAKLEFTKGIPTVAGSLYSLQIGSFNLLTTPFDLDVVVHGIIGSQEEL